MTGYEQQVKPNPFLPKFFRSWCFIAATETLAMAEAGAQSTALPRQT